MATDFNVRTAVFILVLSLTWAFASSLGLLLGVGIGYTLGAAQHTDLILRC